MRKNGEREREKKNSPSPLFWLVAAAAAFVRISRSTFFCAKCTRTRRTRDVEARMEEEVPTTQTTILCKEP